MTRPTAVPRTCIVLLAVVGGTAIAAATVSLKGKDGTVTIDLPDGWTNAEPPASANASVQILALNKPAGTGVLVGAEDRADVTWSLKEYATRSIDRLKNSPKFTNTSQTDLEAIKVNGHDAVRCEFRCTVGGVKLAYLNTYVQTDKSFLSVSAWSVQSKFDRLKPTLATLATAVKETDPPADK